MQGAARGGHAPGHHAPPDETPAAAGRDPPNSSHATPRSGQLTCLFAWPHDFADVCWGLVLGACCLHFASGAVVLGCGI